MHIYWVKHNPADDPGNARGDTVPPSSDCLDSARFSALFTEHHATLWTIAAAVQRDRVHAHDVLQEAAMVAMTKLHEFDPATSFPAWMSQIVRFVALNEGRKHVRHRSRGTHEDSIEPTPLRRDGTTAHTLALVGSDNSLFDAALARALSVLDEKSRTCLLLRTVRNLPYAAIATILDMPEGTVMSIVHRAKASLRDALSSFAPTQQLPPAAFQQTLVQPSQSHRDVALPPNAGAL